MSLIVSLLASFATLTLAGTAPRDFFRSADVNAVRAFVREHATSNGNFDGVVRDARFGVAAVHDLGGKLDNSVPLCALAAKELAETGDDEKRLIGILNSAVLVSTLKCADVKPSAASRKVLVDSVASAKLANVYAGVVGLRSLERAGHSELSDKDAQTAVRTVLALAADNGQFQTGGGSKATSAFNAGLAFEALAEARVSPADAKKALANLGKLLDGAASTDGGASLYFNDETSESAHSLANVRATSTVAYGLFTLAKHLGKNAASSGATVPATFVVGVADYFGQHKRVRTLAEAAALARGLHAVADLAPQSPLVVTLETTAARTGAKAPVNVRVTDILGRAPSAGGVKSVTATRFALVGGDGSALFQGRAATAGKDAGTFVVSVDDALTCGRYTLTLDAAAGIEHYIGASGAVRELKVTCKATPHDVTLSVNGKRVAELSYPKQGGAGAAHQVGAKDTLAVAFKVRDSATKQALRLQQAMVRLVHANGVRDVIVPAVAGGAPGEYSAELKLTPATQARLGREAGDWRVELVLGDQILEEAVVWDATTVNFALTGTARVLPGEVNIPPVIDHQFRAPASRPVAAVSLAFTALALAPLLLLFGLLPRAGFNTRALPGGAASILVPLFHILLAGVLVILGLYWLMFNLVQTVTYLAVIAVPFIFVGRQLLGQLQLQRSKNN
jgi:hypothetical protein